jgi:hypothetical protein
VNAIYSLGGAGKTQIALEDIHQLHKREPDCSVFWIPVTNIESIQKVYLDIGQQLQIPHIEKKTGGYSTTSSTTVEPRKL